MRRRMDRWLRNSLWMATLISFVAGWISGYLTLRSRLLVEDTRLMALENFEQSQLRMNEHVEATLVANDETLTKIAEDLRYLKSR